MDYLEIIVRIGCLISAICLGGLMVFTFRDDHKAFKGMWGLTARAAVWSSGFACLAMAVYYPATPELRAWAWTSIGAMCVWVVVFHTLFINRRLDRRKERDNA